MSYVNIYRFGPDPRGGGGWRPDCDDEGGGPGDGGGYDGGSGGWGGRGRHDPWLRLKAIVGFLLVLWVVNLALSGGLAAIHHRVRWYLLYIPAIIIALTLHEVGHAAMASFLGDPTARRQGRLSLNPLAHLDLMGSLMLLFAGFGWARPVPVDSRYFRKPLRAMAAVAVSGPLMNLLLAVCSAVMVKVFAPEAVWTTLFFAIFMRINLALMFFNLIPLPPLDGSKIIEPWLSGEQRFWLRANQMTCQVILLVLLAFGVVGAVLDPAMRYSTAMLYELVGLHPVLAAQLFG